MNTPENNCGDMNHPVTIAEERSPLVIVGAHLSGFPLNYQLTKAGAVFSRIDTTSSSYRLYELPSTTNIKKPGLKRVVNGNEVGHSIEIEVWDISDKGLGNLLARIPSPLAIGSVELSGGSWVKGFVCEPWGFENARDISSFGGWRTYMKSGNPDSVSTKPGTDGSSTASNRYESDAVTAALQPPPPSLLVSRDDKEKPSGTSQARWC